jgi:hypothetical protein
MQEFLKVKQNSSNMVSILRKCAGQAITNEVIAQLNDMAYKAVKTKHKQKKID